MKQRDKIIVTQTEYNTFTRWLLGVASLKGWTQYRRGGWQVTALYVQGALTEVLFEREGIRAVDGRLWRDFCSTATARQAAVPELEAA